MFCHVHLFFILFIYFFFSFYQFQFVDYLLNTPLVVEVWGKQSGRRISRKETGGEINRPTATKKASVGQKNSGMTNGEVMVRISN